MQIDGIFRSWANLGAGWVLWLLVALSVIAMAVILERLVFFISTRANTLQLASTIERANTPSKRTVEFEHLAAAASSEARILAAGMQATCASEAEERMAAETQRQRLRAEQHLAFLSTLATNAPFVGLLGTVIGIIRAFAELDAAGGQLTSGLMAQIGEALIATAVGLLVALPAVTAHNAFQRAIVVRLSNAEALGRQFIAQLHANAPALRSSTRVFVADAQHSGAE